MKFSPALVVAAAGIGIGVAAYASSSGGSSTVIQVNPGETYQIVGRAVGTKMSQGDIDMLIAISTTAGNTVKSATLNDAGDTLTATILYGKATRLTLNKLISSTLTPNQGLIITSAAKVTTS